MFCCIILTKTAFGSGCCLIIAVLNFSFMNLFFNFKLLNLTYSLGLLADNSIFQLNFFIKAKGYNLIKIFFDLTLLVLGFC